MERDNPFVHVYAANEDTIVHIRQLIYTNDGGHTTPRESCDGVVMTLMQFRSLMFHLRALDAQFMQGSEMRLTSPCENESKRIGKKRTWKEIDDDDDPAHKTCKQGQADVVAWEEMNDILSSLGESSDVQAESKSSVVQESLPYIPTPILSKKEVRDELAIAYAEEILPLLPNLVNDTCSGCKNNVDRNSNAQQHDVCLLPRKKRIELFTEMALLSIDASSVHDKVMTRSKNRHATFNEQWAREDRQSLITMRNWMHKLKMYVFDL